MKRPTHVPLNKLIAWEGNARSTISEEALAELDASIEALGLLQPPVVKENGRNFAVVDGKCRLIVLQRRAEAGKITQDFPVPVTFIDDENADEVTIAANTIRQSMHPADEFVAFRNLIAAGKSINFIASRFGKTARQIEQRMKLGQVSPQVLHAYRDGELDLEEVMAFTLTDDHVQQEAVLASLGEFDGGRDIRRALTQDKLAATDRRARFIRREYDKANGALDRNLFSEGDEDEVFLTDIPLVDKLTDEKLQKLAKKVAKEGWKDVLVRPHLSFAEKNQYDELLGKLSEPLADELKTIREELEIIEDSEEEEHVKRAGAIQERMAEIEDARAFTPEQKAMGVSFVSIDDGGKAYILRGYVPPEEETEEQDAGDNDAEETPQTASEPEPEFSMGLIEDLTAQRSAALSSALANDNQAALAAVVHAMAAQVFYRAGSFTSCLQIAMRQQSFLKAKDSKAVEELDRIRQHYKDVLPDEYDGLWVWCLEQDRESLIDLMAFCAALTVDAIQTKAERAGKGRLGHADQLAAKLQLDMTKFFTATAPNYFSRVSKEKIVEALREIEATLPSGTAKKADIAKLAEQAVAGKRWLPKMLRAAPAPAAA
jgi:ParB family chromosome partitioning protein